MPEPTEISTSVSPSAAASRRTQAARRAESDQKLLLAAASLIAEEGFNAATFEKIGARAGYSRGLASQRFGSKDGLIEALIDYLHTRFEELVFAEGLGDARGLDAILASVDIFLRHFRSDEALRAYFVAMSASVGILSPLRSAFAASHVIAKERYACHLREGQEDGSISKAIDAEASALMIGSIVLGVSTQCLIDPTTDINRVRQTTLNTLRRSLAA